MTSSTDNNGYGNVSLSPKANGTVRVAASSGGSTVGYNVTFENVSVSGEQVTGVDESVSSSGGSGQVEFELTNNGDSDVTISGIKLNSTSNSADKISDTVSAGGSELYTGEITIGETVSLDSNQLITSGSTVSFTINKFRDGNGAQDMSGSTFTMIFYFTNGDEETIDFTVN